MANGSNKTGLLNFLAREWSENVVYAGKIKEHTLFVTHGDNCTKLSASDGTITACTVCCDSVSAFSTKGKKKALDIVQLNPALRQIVSSFGERFPPNEEDLTKMERFVCALLNDPSCNDVNELRYKLFCKSKNLQ